MNNDINITTAQKTQFTFPFSKKDRELCEVYEHDGYPNWKYQLFQAIFPLFETLLDLTPRFGFFAITAKLINPSLRLGVKKDSSGLTDYLSQNLISNQVNHHFALPQEITPSVIQEGLTNIAKTLVRSTSVLEIIHLLRCFDLTKALPALLIETNEIDDYSLLTTELVKIHYQLYSHAPLTGKLLPLSSEQLINQESNLIFAFTAQQAKILNLPTIHTIKAPIEIAPLFWKTMLYKQPYANACFHEWENNSTLEENHLKLLNQVIFALSDENETNRIHLMLASFKKLQAMVIDDLSFPQLMTAARITYELGLKQQTNIYLSRLIEIFQTAESLNLSEPFLPPLSEYTEYDTKEDIIHWCLSVILEAYEINRADSCFEMNHNDADLLAYYLTFPYPAVKLSQRLEIYQTLKNSQLQTKEITNTSYEKHMNKPQVAIIYHLARTGGTLISKCIASIEGNILLSEVHPTLSVSHPIEQAHQWFNLVPQDKVDEYKSGLNYTDNIKIIQERTALRNKNLVIRDWSHIDFTGIPFIDKCSYNLTQTSLLKESFSINQIATVRHPVDSYISLSKLAIMQDKLNVDVYLAGAKEFALKAVEIGFVKYEDFCQDPKQNLAKICDSLKISYHDNFLTNFSTYTKITGDIANERKENQYIKASTPKSIEVDLAKTFKDNEDYWEILSLLNYQNTL